MLYLYEGDGGLYQAFAGIGKSWGGLSVGINTGYMFGRKENTTRAIPIDSVLTYKSKFVNTYNLWKRIYKCRFTIRGKIEQENILKIWIFRKSETKFKCQKTNKQGNIYIRC